MASSIEVNQSPYVFEPKDTTSPLTDFVLEAGQSSCKSPDAPALIDGASGRSISFGQLRPLIRSCAAGFYTRGLKQGGVLAILSPNLPEYCIAFHAAASLGAKVTTINPSYTAQEIAHQLKDAGAEFVITIKMFASAAQEAVAMSEVQIRGIYLFDGADEEASIGSCPVTAYKTLLAGGDDAFPEVQIKPNDVVAIPYSSGTSGLPKGVMLTHANLVAQLQQLQAVHLTLTNEDTLIGVLPFFHIYGMVVILNVAVCCGATTVTLPKFDPPLFLKVLKEYGVTVAHVAPPLVGFLAKHPAVESVLPLPKLKELFSGAAPLSSELAAAAMKRLDVPLVRQGYGMTEMSPASHIHPYDALPEKIGSIGTLVPGMTCKVVSTENDLPVGVGERGEFWLSGPNIMAGYLNNAAATAETIDSDGFLHTGDVGYVDSDGYYWIVDRVKELIKVKGFQVAPAELEGLLLSSESIADAAVIGLPDLKAGEAVKAYVVKQKGHESLTEESVQAFVKGQVAAYKQITHVEFVENVPKSAAGKILRKDLRKMEEARRVVAEAQELVKPVVQDKRTIWVDVRSPREFAELPRFPLPVKNIPVKMGDSPETVKQQFLVRRDFQSNQLPLDTPIVVFCAKGGRAQKAKETLEGLGYSKVINGRTQANVISCLGDVPEAAASHESSPPAPLESKPPPQTTPICSPGKTGCSLQ